MAAFMVCTLAESIHKNRQKLYKWPSEPGNTRKFLHTVLENGDYKVTTLKKEIINAVLPSILSV